MLLLVSQLLLMSATVLMAVSIHVGLLKYWHPLICHPTDGPSFPLAIHCIGGALDANFRFHVINGETIRNAENTGAALFSVTVTLAVQLLPVFVRGGVNFVGVVLDGKWKVKKK